VLLSAFLDVEHRRTARCTKREPTLCTFIVGTNELLPFPFDVHRFSRKPCLNGEHAAGSTLALIAVANRHVNRLAGYFRSEWATVVGCRSSSHDKFLMKRLSRLTTTRRKFVFFHENGSSNSVAEAGRAPLQLARIQLDDQLLVDHRLNLFPRRNARYFAFERIAIDRQPIGNWNDLG
jgi:hypothetical protein